MTDPIGHAIPYQSSGQSHTMSRHCWCRPGLAWSHEVRRSHSGGNIYSVWKHNEVRPPESV